MAALLLLRRGEEVVGATMRLGGDAPRSTAAAQVAAYLGIEHHLVDVSADFHALVVEPFLAAYAGGRTPNPCVACNDLVKFGVLLRFARELGCDALATGHYARIVRVEGVPRLAAAVDRAKDQSYFLYRLGPDRLRQVVFPLGEMTKGEVRRLAAQEELPAARRSESQDICFAVDYRRLFKGREGPIVDTRGRVLGRHKGVFNYTVGQRRGLGLSAGKPLYVVRLDPARNAVVVGSREELLAHGLVAEDLVWAGGGAGPVSGTKALVKIRSAHEPVPATVEPLPGGCARVLFARPVAAVAPGQAAVFYEGDVVLGGGTIAEALSP